MSHLRQKQKEGFDRLVLGLLPGMHDGIRIVPIDFDRPVFEPQRADD
jgi:hypothetical protein